jgi:hypothetical protein
VPAITVTGACLLALLLAVPVVFVSARAMGRSLYLRGWSDLLAFAATAAYVVGLWVLSTLRRLSGELSWAQNVRNGCCVGCGYDLKESKGRCPECGKPIDETIYRALRSKRRARNAAGHRDGATS